ncbi:MAG: hypothetical protein ACI4QA_03810 [Candidatus Spyradosoma sp.]
MTLEEKAEIARNAIKKDYPNKDIGKLIHFGRLGDDDFFGSELTERLLNDYGAIRVGNDGKHERLDSFDFMPVWHDSRFIAFDNADV